MDNNEAQDDPFTLASKFLQKQPVHYAFVHVKVRLVPDGPVAAEGTSDRPLLNANSPFTAALSPHPQTPSLW